MDRTELGQKIAENLAIQGELEEVKAELQTLKDNKNEADITVKKGLEAEKVSNSLAQKIEDAENKVKSLEAELSKSDKVLSSANAKVPRIINEIRGPMMT